MASTLAVGIAGAFVGRLQPTCGEWLAFGLVLGLAMASSLRSRRNERIRRALGDGLVPDLHGAWVVVSAVVLPAPLITAAAILIFLAEVPVRRSEHKAQSQRRQPAYKLLFTVASVSIAAVVAHLLYVLTGNPLVGIACVVVAIVVVNNGLIYAAITLASQKPKLALFFGSIKRQLFDVVSTVCGAGIGAVLAAATDAGRPAFDLVAVVGLPALFWLQKLSIEVERHQPDVIDSATNLMTAARWHDVAQAELDCLPDGQHWSLILVQLLDEAPETLQRAGSVVGGLLDEWSGPAAPMTVAGRSDAATIGLLLMGERPELSAWRRTVLHQRLERDKVAHMVAIAYPREPGDQLHDVLIRVGGRLLAWQPAQAARSGA